MSAWTAPALPRTATPDAPTRPRLRSVPIPDTRMSIATFSLGLVALVVVGMVGLLILNTQLQNQAFAVRDAQRSASELGYQVSDLESQVTRMSAPANLGPKAAALGMAPNTHAVFIDLEKGTIVGKPVAVTGGEMPSLRQVAPAPAPAPATGAPDPAASAPAAAPTTSPAPSTQPAASAPASPAPSVAPAAKPSASPAPTAAAKPSTTPAPTAPATKPTPTPTKAGR